MASFLVGEEGVMWKLPTCATTDTRGKFPQVEIGRDKETGHRQHSDTISPLSFRKENGLEIIKHLKFSFSTIQVPSSKIDIYRKIMPLRRKAM
jgi:hypothetical protein